MSSELGLYLCAAREMDSACELISRILAQQVRSLRWRIKRTPHAGDLTPDAEALASSQFLVLLLGSDLVAPMGVEYQQALRQGTFVIALHDATRIPSPSADYITHLGRQRWLEYKSAAHLALLFERNLLRQLIDGTPGYGLDLEQIEAISARLSELEAGPEAAPEQPRGAGEGGVILPGY
ncbi:MAG: hypothetical protein GXY52_03745 [Chloroflexi bacterium]|nr:hypothetical protein [Chloroflexota bacterium]